MADSRRGTVLGQTDFPLYTIRMVGDRHFMVAGGGGPAKTGIPNVIEIYEIGYDSNGIVANRVQRYDPGSRAIMNSAICRNGKNYLLAAGMDDECQLYMLRHKITTVKDTEVSDAQNDSEVRKRKGNLTSSQPHKVATKKLTFEFEELDSVVTDFHKDGGFQKVVQFGPDKSIFATGGADGFLRVWKFPDLKKLYEVNAHTNEIDDIDFSPPGDRIVTVSKDGHGRCWNTENGSKFCDLCWTPKTDIKYRFRSCGFGLVEDKKGAYFLYTTQIPVIRGHGPLPCYITKWDPRQYNVLKTVNAGTEILSAFSISRNGTFLAVGTISGSVSVYIAFSLQLAYSVRKAHNIFVTGLEFTENKESLSDATDYTLLSISADNQIKLHQQSAPGAWHVLWVIGGSIVIIYLFFWLISAFGI